MKVDIIEILNNADGMEHVAIYCANDKGENETMVKVTDIIKLLNSQKAEIERLETMHSEMCIGMKVLKKTAIKDYKEKVKAILILVKNALNEAEKEMVGDTDEQHT